MDKQLTVPELSLIVPCFNEAETVGALTEVVAASLTTVQYEIVFVDDGSTDDTAAVIEGLQKKMPDISLVRFTKNAGHQQAIRAGLRASRGRYIVTLDADLQHPPELIPAMLEKAQQGADVVYMVRSEPQKGLIKNFLSKEFYRSFNQGATVEILPNASDFRLLSRRVCDIVNALPERNIFLRALIPQLGFPSASIEFKASDRYAGTPSYSLKSSYDLGLNAFINFTNIPLEVGFRFGIVVSSLAFIYALFAVYAKLFTDMNVPGYTDIICSVLFFGGLILVYLGVLGKYISLIIDHLKMRPEYIIESITRSSEPPSNDSA